MVDMSLGNRLLLLFRLTDCSHSFRFLCDAFVSEAPGEIAITVLELCEAGYLCANANGLQLSTKVVSALPDALSDVDNANADNEPIEAASPDAFAFGFDEEAASPDAIAPSPNEETAIASDVEACSSAEIAEPFDESVFTSDVVAVLDGAAEGATSFQSELPSSATAADASNELSFQEPTCSEESHEVEQLTLNVENAHEEPTLAAPDAESDALEDTTDSIPGAPTSEDVPCIYSYDPISVLNLSKKAEAKLLEMGLASVRDLVAALGDGDALQGTKPEIVDVARLALRRCAAVPSYSFSIDQLDTLIGLSGSTEFVFDLFGSPIDVAALCERDGLEIEKCADEQCFQVPIESLQVAAPKIRKLKRLGCELVSDVVLIGEKDLVERYGFYPQDAAVIFNQIEQLEGEQPQAQEGSSLAQFDRRLSTPALKVIRYVQGELERMDYPVVREEAHVFVAPLIVQLLQEPRAVANGAMVKRVMQQIDELPETKTALLETIWKRARATIASMTNNSRLWIAVEVPNAGCWTLATQLACRNYQGRCEVFDELSSRMLCLQFEVRDLESWLGELPPHVQRLINLRLDGAKNKECAEAFKISKDNAVKAIRRILQQRPFIAEERYLGLYEAYDMTPAQFEQETGQSSRVYRFLREISPVSSAAKLPYGTAAAHEQQASDEDQRATVSGDTDIVEAGERLAPKRQSLLEYVIRTKATDYEISVTAAYDAYLELLSRHGLQQSDWVLFSALPQFDYYVENEIPIIVSSYGTDIDCKMIRYYDVDAYDYSALNKLLGELAVRNVECGIELLFNDERIKAQCELLDLRTADELYFAICRYCGEVQDVVAETYPLIAFGNADRNAQVKAVIREFGPAPSWAIAKEYCREYGVPEPVFEKSFLDPFESLRQGSLYLADADEADDAQVAFLKEELANAGSCCSFSLVKSRFEVRFSEQNVNLGDEALWERLGWRRTEKLLMKNSVDEREYFSGLIDGSNRFSLNDAGFGDDVTTHSLFRSELEKRKRAFAIIEANDGEFWSTEPFARLATPIMPNDMRDYVNSAIRFMQEDVPYTVKSLRDAGFRHKLDSIEDELDIDKHFFESVLSEGYLNGALKKTRLGGSTVFCRIDGSYSGSLFLQQVLREQEAFEVADLVDYVRERYGIEVGESKLRQLIKRSGDYCYYCETVDMVFASVEAYGRKVQEWL